ncbi:YeeE/YedE family protein [Rubrobacter marinus]|uniref:YeeE/YedE family protein n=1 Tax=Rubrobacter marinus TaxID=2653852 RepID=UPI001A9FEED2|nr:YeeE/YedE family protein [Rubrobacter marinus]
MSRIIVALFAGALFGVGLVVSGMADPQKVIGFLDFAGDWDPTLLFVMGGALLVTMPAFRLILKRPRPVLADGFDLPTKSAPEARLIGGAALFGLGWGLSGFCPGPAVAALSTGLTPVLAFVASMLAGMAAYAWFFDRPDNLRSPVGARVPGGGPEGGG